MRKYVLAAATPVVGIATMLVAAGPASAADNAAGSSIQLLKLTGAEEAPNPGDPDGVGLFASRADLKNNTFCYAVTAHKIATARVAHVHRAPRGAPGPVIVEIMPPASGFAAACIKAVPESPTGGVLTIPELRAIATTPGDYYVNVHNADFPAGAIRAQFR